MVAVDLQGEDCSRAIRLISARGSPARSGAAVRSAKADRSSNRLSASRT